MYMLATLDTGILTLFLAFLSFFKSFFMIRFRWLESNAAVCPVLLEYRENVRTGIHAMYLVPGILLPVGYCFIGTGSCVLPCWYVPGELLAVKEGSCYDDG